MNHGRTVFAQLLDFVPFKHFEYLVEKFSANHAVKSFSAWSHFLCLAYAQLTRRTGLRDLVACLNSQRTKLYHVGIRSRVSRTTLADAGHAAIATGVSPHITLSYCARDTLEKIALDPPLAWTIDELLLVIGGGQPYAYEVIGRWPLLPETDPPATQMGLF